MDFSAKKLLLLILKKCLVGTGIAKGEGYASYDSIPRARVERN